MRVLGFKRPRRNYPEEIVEALAVGIGIERRGYCGSLSVLIEPPDSGYPQPWDDRLLELSGAMLEAAHELSERLERLGGADLDVSELMTGRAWELAVEAAENGK